MRSFVGAAIVLSLAALACGGSTTENVVSPSSGRRCPMSLALPGSLPAAGGSVTAQLATSRECEWAASTTAAWLQIAPVSGQGEALLTLAAVENPQGRVRTTTVDVNDQQFAVTQDAQPCRFDVTPLTVHVPHTGGRVSVQVTTLDGCTWTTQSSQPWLRVVSGSGGDVSATLELAVDSNTGAERSALMSVATAVVAVTQDAGPEDRSACRYSIGPGGVVVPAAGGAGSFGVSTLPGCAWGPVSNQSWLVIVSSLNGTGPGRVEYQVAPNPSPGSRYGVISVGTRRHIVNQEGMRP